MSSKCACGYFNVLAFLVVSQITIARGAFDTFPVKSINLGLANKVKSWNVPGVAIEDAHGVEGIGLSGGGYVIVGKGLENDKPAAKNEAFATRLDANGKSIWVWSSGVQGDDVANGAVQLPGMDGDILVVGFRTVAGIAYRSITRLGFADGVELWTARFPDDGLKVNVDGVLRQSHGALASIALSKNDNSVVVGGFYRAVFGQGINTEVMSFKSYGNPSPMDGQSKAFVAKLLLDPLIKANQPNQPPTLDALWSRSFSATYVRTVRVINDDVAVIITSFEDRSPGVQYARLMGTTGALIWGPKGLKSSGNIGFIEAVDMEASFDGRSLFLAGMTSGPSGSNGISGMIAKVNAINGNLVWSNRYDAGGIEGLLFTECWGLKQDIDGNLVLGCGTGIEGCDKLTTGVTEESCKKGIGDLRPGAYPRPPGVWLAFTVKANATTGSVVWQRADGYRSQEAPPLGDPNYEARSSAVEFVIRDKNGALAMVIDDSNGIGLMVLEPTSIENDGDTNKATTLSPGSKTSTKKSNQLLSTTNPIYTSTQKESKRSSILLAGDSMASYASNFLNNFCGDGETTVFNAGIGGTLLSDWNSEKITNSFGDSGFRHIDYIWISLGGNDFLGSNCMATEESLKVLVQASIQRFRAASPESKLIMTGYAIPMQQYQSPFCTPQSLKVLNDAIKNAAAAEAATYVDIHDMLGGGYSPGKWSNAEYFVDPIHLNQKGYIKIFSSDKILNAFNCPTSKLVDSDVTTTPLRTSTTKLFLRGTSDILTSMAIDETSQDYDDLFTKKNSNGKMHTLRFSLLFATLCTFFLIN